MAETQQRVILITVLDWGLGHAGRIVPLVNEFQRQGARVILASAGRAGLLLQEECPDLTYIPCPAYSVHYRGRNMYWTMFRQLPKIAAAVVKEQLWLRQLHRQFHFDAIISDSRFGCFHSKVTSVMVTHQLRLSLAPAWLAGTVNWMYRQWLNRFDEIWVPDIPDGLSGKLSFPSPFSNTQYLGILSRMIPLRLQCKYDLLVLLSGPEPQRTHLERIVVQQLQDKISQLSVLLIQGKTEQSVRQMLAGTQTELVSSLSGKELNEALAASRVVLCRSGYSSLMDLVRLQKSAILISTPGQPEQEYLAQRCGEFGWAYVCKQDELILRKAVLEVSRMPYRIAPEHEHHADRMEQVVAGLLTSLRDKKDRYY
ncbi:MAG: glycosyltransferase [Saprospiraceae bacterium]